MSDKPKPLNEDRDAARWVREVCQRHQFNEVLAAAPAAALTGETPRADTNAVQAWQIAEDDVRFFVPLADARKLERELAEVEKRLAMLHNEVRR